MADRDEADILRRPADCMKGENPSDAGSIPEASDPMLDVHLRHGAAHTWKDFWIHLGTISIGLLIAIGLEQSVEAVHRLHERYRLEEDLQTEAKHNLAIVVKNNQYFEPTRVWLIQLRSKVDEMRRGGEKVRLDYPPTPNKGAMDWPGASSWNVAKASARVTLLPRVEAQMYDFVYSAQSNFIERGYAYAGTLRTIRRFESRFVNLASSESSAEKTNTEQEIGDLTDGSIYHDTPIPVLSEMTSEDLREYSVLLNDALIELGQLHLYNNIIYQWIRAVTLGAMSEDQLRQLLPATQLSDTSASDRSAAH